MGLGMMVEKNLSRLLKTTFKVLILAAALGCSKEPEESLAPLGLEANPADINQALTKALGSASVHNAKVGQMVHYEENYRVDLNTVTKLTDNVRQLIQIKDNPISRTYVLNDDFYQYDNSGAIKDEKHSEVAVEYQKNPPTISAIKTMSSGDPDCGKERQLGDGETYDCIGYYNLSAVDVAEPAPALARLRANCSNIPDCSLPSVAINFDRVYFLKNKIVYRENLKFSISEKIPILFPEADLLPFNYFCVSSRYEASTSSFWVNRCTVLRDLSL
jgi:hypothetical protein